MISKRLRIVCICAAAFTCILLSANKSYATEIDNVSEGAITEDVWDNEDDGTISEDDQGNVDDGGIDPVLPGKIKNLKTTALSSKKVELSWDASDGCIAYKVYKRNNSGTYKEIAEVTKNHARLSVDAGKSYTFKVTGIYEIDGCQMQTKGREIDFYGGEIVNISGTKYTYKEMKADIKALSEKYSNYVSFEAIGTTSGGREIYDVILGNPNAKKTLLVVCTLHAREYVATVNAMKQVEYYLKNYNHKIDDVKPADVFDTCNVHYVMMANPDGVTYSQNVDARWKANGRGVNLNLNFPFAFRKEGTTSSGTSSGSKALSEKETQAIAALTKQLKKEGQLAVLNYHAMGEIVFGGYLGKDKKVKSMISKMYQVARETTGYADAAGYDGIGYGNYREYVMYTLNIPSITIELGNVPCPISGRYYSSIFDKNKYVVLRMAQLL